jgi:hypothetical protein
MPDERLEMSVTFDERHGYVASAPELRTAVVALSLGGLRRKIEIAAGRSRSEDARPERPRGRQLAPAPGDR